MELIFNHDDNYTVKPPINAIIQEDTKLTYSFVKIFLPEICFKCFSLFSGYLLTILLFFVFIHVS